MSQGHYQGAVGRMELDVCGDTEQPRARPAPVPGRRDWSFLSGQREAEELIKGIWNKFSPEQLLL